MTQEIDWEFNWSREYSNMYGSSSLYGYIQNLKKDLGMDIDARGQGANGWYSTFFTKGAKAKLIDLYTQKMQNDIEYIREKMQLLEIDGEKFVKFTKSLKVNKDTSIEDLKKLLDEYYTYILNYTEHLYRSFYMVKAGEDLFEQTIISKANPKQVNEIIKSYSIPLKKAGIFIIANKFKKLKSTDEKVAFLLKEYPWITCGDPFISRMNQDSAKIFAESIKEPKEIVKEITLDLDQNEKNIVKAYQEMLYLKDKRDEYRREAFHYGLKLIEEIESRLNIPKENLSVLMPVEINMALDGENVLDLIEKRKLGYIVEVIDSLETTREGKQVVSEFVKQEDDKNTDEIKGITGCSGKVRGKVQLIKHSKDIKNFKKGNILVAITTNPEYVPAMDKAIAFVTDEGGITSHAAIVAREQNKPCIIGTQVATKILKDNDIVEVDANHGIIKKI
tara:strand:+ start:5437 stop:6777 length:1341 start_codon:yes stop_codon:yes gene_type:complete